MLSVLWYPSSAFSIKMGILLGSSTWLKINGRGTKVICTLRVLLLKSRKHVSFLPGGDTPACNFSSPRRREGRVGLTDNRWRQSRHPWSPGIHSPCGYIQGNIYAVYTFKLETRRRLFVLRSCFGAGFVAVAAVTAADNSYQLFPWWRKHNP